jgi:TPR repeat protein
MELEKCCYFAVIVGEEALLGIPKEERIEFSPAYAPFKPENLSAWQEAAGLGILNGCYLLGHYLVNVGKTEEGSRWLKIAISKGHVQAKRALGEFLLDKGKTGEGLRLLQELADSGDAPACNSLAIRYQNGEGVPRSRAKYRSYLERAARLGSRYAQHCFDADNFLSDRLW